MRSLKTSGFFLFAIFFLVGCVSIPIGDGNSVKLSKDGVTVTDKEGQESTIDFNEDEGTLTFNVENEDGDKIQTQLGQNIKVPDNFPDDIPLPDDANIVGASGADDHVLLVITSNITYEQLDKIYTEFFNDPAFVEQPTIVEQDYGGGERMKIFNGIRSDGAVQVSVLGKNEDSNEDFATQLTVSFAEVNE